MQNFSVLNRFAWVAVPALFLMISVKAKTINLSADSEFRNFSDAAGQAAPYGWMP